MKKILGIFALLSAPFVILFVAGTLTVFVMIFFSGAGVQEKIESTENSSSISHLAYCSKDGEVDMGAWNSFVTNQKMSGALKNYGDYILSYSQEKGVDPVLVMAIMTLETGYGTSDALIYNNNPGGNMDPKTNWETLMSFRTMEDGINFTINNIARLVLQEGLVTIEDLGNVYAPLGAKNDPKGLNKNWIPAVTKFTNDLGGLTQNCTKLGDLEFVDGMAWVVPATKRITSGFGKRSCKGCSSFHNGLDISIGPGQSYGLEVVSLADGEVAQSLGGCVENRPCSSSWGNHVMIDHGNGLFTIYAHFTDTFVTKGQKVEAGDVIGTIGNTGSSQGAHLHFETHVNGTPVDPYNLLRGFFESKGD